LRLSTQQQTAASDLLLQQQIGGLGTTYGKRIDASGKEYAQAYSQSGRAQLARGMGRSSYALQTLANVTTEGAEAKQTILDAKAAAESNLQAQRTQLQSQLASQIMNYDASQSADILKRISELQSTQYDRTYQSQRDAAKDAQWQTEFNETVRQFNESLAANAKSSGGGSSRGSSQVATTPTGMTLDQLIASLGVYGSGSSGLGAGVSLKAGKIAAKTYNNTSLFKNYTAPTVSIAAARAKAKVKGR
jgi:hypothetical protein